MHSQAPGGGAAEHKDPGIYRSKLGLVCRHKTEIEICIIIEIAEPRV